MAGDITSALSYRTMMNIIGFIEMVDQVVPGFASYETLLYAPEIKFYSNRVKIDEKFDARREEPALSAAIPAGWTRGLMMASVMGVLMGRELV